MRPIQDGVIADDSALELLKNLVGQIRWTLDRSARVAVCIPARISQLVERAMISTTKAAGAGSVYLIEEPLAAAIGAGISGGDGWCLHGCRYRGWNRMCRHHFGNVAVSTLNYAGDAMDQALIEYVRSHHDLIIGPAMPNDSR